MDGSGPAAVPAGMGRIGGYLVERRLGEGGMRTVPLARTRGGRAVALKVAEPNRPPTPCSGPAPVAGAVPTGRQPFG
ncbi:hypothetical protein ADL04_20005 [Streptomyces sp. NRRL B-3648]|nr:hypothetical protein ADL04_20005 [Streptomyces sp. NRRL B-3648]